MTGLLDGRIALITGAGSGIGEAIAYAMAKAGARIVAVDIVGDAAARTATAIGGAAARRRATFAMSATARNAMRSPRLCGATSVRFRSWSTTPGSSAADK